jgi:hypothetical protein
MAFPAWRRDWKLVRQTSSDLIVLNNVPAMALP